MKRVVVFSLIFAFLAIHCSADCSAWGRKETVYADGGYIKWIDFNVTYRALCDALKADIESYGSANHVGWVEVLAYLASRNGGNFSSYKSADTKKLLDKISDGSGVASHVTNEKLYKYYLEAYGAILGGMVGEYTEVRVAPGGSETRTQKYGLRAFSPIAAGYYYGECDDFGNTRSFAIAPTPV